MTESVFTSLGNNGILNTIWALDIIWKIVGFLIISIPVFIMVFWKSIKVLYRIGRGLSKRKVAILALNWNGESLEKTLIESGLFRKGNIGCYQIVNLEDAKWSDVFILDWETFQEKLDDVLHIKEKNTTLIVYARYGLPPIPKEIMEKICERTDTVVVNFRGRLLNDVVTSFITMSFSK